MNTVFKRITLLVIISMLIAVCHNANAQLALWQKGVLKQEFIYENAPFPECHSATIAQTPGGLVAAWFGGTKERNPDVCIWVSRLIKSKWTAPENVANGIMNDTLRYPTWNPVLFQVPGGELLLFYKIGSAPASWKGYIRSSKNNGVSWSAQRALPEGYIGPVKNKPVMLTDGTMMCPTSSQGHGWQVYFETSKDAGNTWQKTKPVNPPKDSFNVIQPSILQHGGGKLQIICRSTNRALITSWSTDNGKTWSPLSRTSLPNNNSGTDAVTLKDGRHLLVYNHVLPPGKEAKGPRTPLHIAISNDGIKWYAAAILEDSPISQYSYPSVIQTNDGLVHIVYTWRRQRIKHAVIDPAKLPVKEIINGKWPALAGYTTPVVDAANTEKNQ